MTIVLDGSVGVYFADRGEKLLYDRVRLLDNGYCHGLRTQEYAQTFYPPHEIKRVHDPTGDDPAEQEIDAEYVIDHGAEVWVGEDRDVEGTTTAALLPGGWLVCWSPGGGTRYYPAHMVDSVHTHTNDEQEAAGWFR